MMAELTVFELIKRVNEIASIQPTHEQDIECGDVILYVSCDDGTNYYYSNPLTDDTLWQSLIFKYEVSISFVFGKLLIVNNGVYEKNFTDNISLKRNALLLIIEAHNE